MPLPLTLYSASGCDDTERTRAHPHKLDIPFHKANSDCDPEAERLVVFINHDDRGLSALELSEGMIEIVTTEPINQESNQMLIQGGYSIPHTIQ